MPATLLSTCVAVAWTKRLLRNAPQIDEELAKELTSLQQQCENPSPEAFIFPGRRGLFMDSSNFRKRVLHKSAEELVLPKLTLQVIRRTIATLGKTKGHVKVTLMARCKADHTLNENQNPVVQDRLELGSKARL